MSFASAGDGRYALVVDDNAHAAAMAGAVLEANGWQVDKAHDGFEAIVRFRQRNYSALILDFRLPGMDGAEVLDWVRRNVVDAPEVVVVSSECPRMLQQKFDGMGVRAILSKPATAADLWLALAAA
jgi:CheY-like chemotaxis protein